MRSCLVPVYRDVNLKCHLLTLRSYIRLTYRDVMGTVSVHLAKAAAKLPHSSSTRVDVAESYQRGVFAMTRDR